MIGMSIIIWQLWFAHEYDYAEALLWCQCVRVCGRFHSELLDFMMIHWNFPNLVLLEPRLTRVNQGPGGDSWESWDSGSHPGATQATRSLVFL